MEEKHLKSYQYYSDQYDKHTVEECRWWITNTDHTKALDDAKAKGLDLNEALRVLTVADNLRTYFYTGQRYMEKEKTLEEWMNRDKERDRIAETAVAPKDITCFTCGRIMFVSNEHFNYGDEGKPDRMMYFYDCPLEHMPRRAFYSDGEEHRSKPHLCEKCGGTTDRETKRIKQKIITTHTCRVCKHAEIDELDLTVKKPKEEKPDPNFEVDRARFCLSEKEGRDFIDGQERIASLSKLVNEWKEKEKDKESYDKVAQLQKLKIADLEAMLVPILEKAGYIKLQFKNPEISKDVFVPFIAYDAKADREGRASTYDLEVLLRKTLKNTNWRMMSEGTSYRLGMLEGRLRGYEREEDLLNLVKQQEKKDAKRKTVLGKDGEEITL